MTEKNSIQPQQSTSPQKMNDFKLSSLQQSTNQTLSQVKIQTENHNNEHGIFKNHEEKIKATYNFQSLFRKKSHLYTMHKNKKKPQNSSKQNSSGNKSSTAEQLLSTKLQDDQKLEKSFKRGHWSAEENKKYHWFLELHNNHFINKKLRRTDKIFKTMSSFISSRQAEQCRSHHQKMEKKYKNFYKILTRLRMDHYGTCSTEEVKHDLLENDLWKQKNTKEGLIDEIKLSQLLQMENEDEEGGLNNDHNESGDEDMRDSEDGGKLRYEEGGLLSGHHSGAVGFDFRAEQMKGCENDSSEKGENFFFGENYEKQLNYKLL